MTVTPNTKFSKSFQKYLTFALGDITFTFSGDNVYFWGFSRILRFLVSFLFLGGFGDSLGRGGSVGVSKISEA